MKLSMWMIANQLLELDPELKIRESAPVILNSARLAYATNCVHIYQEGDAVVCNGEGDKIIFRDMEITRVFELIQSIFDVHEDWISSIKTLVEADDYQAVMDAAYKMFKNPMVLMDANTRVLGMTRAYKEDDMDEEWKYLLRYGYSSLNAIRTIKYSEYAGTLITHGQHQFSLPRNKFITYPGISDSMYFSDIYCGRITLMAKERELNPGDGQLLHTLAEVVQTGLGQRFVHSSSKSFGHVFLSLLMGKNYDEEELSVQLFNNKWKCNDTFYLTLIRIDGEDMKADLRLRLTSLTRLIYQHMTDVCVMMKMPYCMILSNRDLELDNAAQRLFQNLLENNPIRIAYSMQVEGIAGIAVLYKQAEYAFQRGSKKDPHKRCCSFREYAVDYIMLTGNSIEDKAMACMPEVYRLWKMKCEGKDEMFHTLKYFLDCERSISQTSAALYLHRNTTVYRIKKIQEYLNCDLNDSYTRNYCIASIYFLELFENEKR